MKIASRDTGPPPISRELSAADEIALLERLLANPGGPLAAHLSAHDHIPDASVWSRVKVHGPVVGIVALEDAPNHNAPLLAEWRLTNDLRSAGGQLIYSPAVLPVVEGCTKGIFASPSARAKASACGWGDCAPSTMRR